jgi:peptidoglycan glycosyltransferase
MMLSPRNRELFLLLISLAIGVLGIYSVAAAALQPLSRIYPLLLSFVLIYLLFHSIARLVSPHADPLLLPIAAFLNGIGLTMIFRTRPNLLQAQLFWLGLGVVLALATLILWKRLREIENYKYLTALAGITLLLSPAFFGKELGGAKLWLSIGRLSMQPAEPAKLLIVIFLAAYLKEKRELLSLSTYRRGRFSMPEPRHLAPLLTMWLLSLLILIFEKDLGSSFLFLAIFLVMIYVATSRLIYVALGGGLFLMGASVCYYLFAHVRLRVDIWINPWVALAGKGYQIVQSLFALASGGFSGAGLGGGFPGYIPAVHTDFIFAAAGEELGYAGAMAILLAYLLFVQRGLAVALRSSKEFEKFLAFGLTSVFGLQSFIIIGGVTKLLPLTGITLPFMSYGGTSLVVNFVLLGLLLAVSQDSGGEQAVSLRLASDPNLSVRNIFVVLLVLFLSAAASLSYWQLWAAERVKNHPANVRYLTRELTVRRGRILTEDGAVVAESRRDKRNFGRAYPFEALYSHLVGFSSTRYGKSGLEKTYNSFLLGEEVGSSQSLFSPEQFVSGNDLTITIDSRLQQTAREALGSRRGAVIALDPRTGAIKAMFSYPSFDPNSIDGSFPSLRRTADDPLVSRATQGLYPPGSTFKMVTVAGALEEGAAKTTDVFAGPQDLFVHGGKVSNYGKQSFGAITLEEAFAESVNTVFAQVGLKLTGTKLVSYAETFGLNQKPPLEIEVRKSQIPLPETMDKLEVAWTSVGQGRLLVTPLQMALVGAAVANGGSIMQPHLLKEIRSPKGEVLLLQAPRVWKRALKPATSEEVKRLMVGAVESGTGRAAALPGIAVAGKTGTAEISKKKKTHAWFVGFAPAENPKVAIAVIIEEAGTGGRVAAPVAREVMEEAMKISDSE